MRPSIPLSPFLAFCDARPFLGLLVVVASIVSSGTRVDAADQKSVAVRLEVTAVGGAPISEVAVGERFKLNAYVQDTSPGAEGVFAAYIDVTFGALATVDGVITVGAAFPALRRGTVSPGYLDNVGGCNCSFDPTGAGPLLLWSAEFVADAAGTLEFKSGDPDDGAFYLMLVYGSDDEVLDVTYGSASLIIVDRPPAPTPVEAFFLPKKIKVKVNDRKPDKSKMIAAGFLDTGPDPSDLNGGATLDIGDASFEALDLSRSGAGKLVYSGAGLALTISPQSSGSSRAKFKLKVTSDSVGLIDPAAPLTVRFRSGDLDAKGIVSLDGGQYTLGRNRGALTAPVLYFYSAKAKLRGGGRDSLKLKAGLGSLGRTPADAPDITVGLGPAYSVKISGREFARSGTDAFVYRSKAPGVTSVVLDFARETMTFKAKGIDLGDFPEGPQPVLVTVGAGTSSAVLVRMRYCQMLCSEGHQAASLSCMIPSSYL